MDFKSDEFLKKVFLSIILFSEPDNKTSRQNIYIKEVRKMIALGYTVDKCRKDFENIVDTIEKIYKTSYNYIVLGLKKDKTEEEKKVMDYIQDNMTWQKGTTNNLLFHLINIRDTKDTKSESEHISNLLDHNYTLEEAKEIYRNC